ncbi:hypothetical protein BJ322DRAFT_1105063 [Thelephora terrestris]|uniref:Uncharacterized protein n=1 Tax=Thelephora terrestris TaxID=56493 RepID=A0A9P6HKB6_9AGAM|nr:hypothetical protein BJ322DRAFT_1105063 [Thelephora terrestris]
MSPSFPPEIFDLVIDVLQDEPTTLKACCLVSKSWVPRTRRRLFALVLFASDGATNSLGSWMKAFPDPSDSPAHYARNLTITGFAAVEAATTYAHAWVRPFSMIVGLVVTMRWDNSGVALNRLHGLSPTLKSLSVGFDSLPLPEVIDFACSFPFLEDLFFHATRNRHICDPHDIPSTSPKFTGSLVLSGECDAITRRLLELPGGLHFSKITMRCVDVGRVMGLISRCSHTLESLSLVCFSGDKLNTPAPLDLSKLAKLKYVGFQWNRWDIQWITASLQTTKSKCLRRIAITINPSRSFFTQVGETIYREWQDLDRLPVELWTSRSIVPKLRFHKEYEGDTLEELVPQLYSRGAVEKPKPE